MEWVQIIKLFGIPGAVTGVIIWLWQRSWAKKETVKEAKEEKRERMELFHLQELMAVSAVARATAKAVQRIPEAHCNGDMTEALDYEKSVRHKQKDFLDELGIHALHDD